MPSSEGSKMFDAGTKAKLASPGANRYFSLHFTEVKTLVKSSVEKNHRGTQQSELSTPWQLQVVITPLFTGKRQMILLGQQRASCHLTLW